MVQKVQVEGVTKSVKKDREIKHSDIQLRKKEKMNTIS